MALIMMTSLRNAVLLGVTIFASCIRAVSDSSSSGSRPNFVFIITDDQDLHLSSLDYQPLVKQYLADEGTTFNKHYCTVALCCPSRVSLLTGRAAHNTNVTDVSLPYGGYQQFINNGLNEAYLPVWLQEAGYNTYYAGKLMNALSITTYNNPWPAGWDDAEFLLDPQTYWYYNASSSRNNQTYEYFPGNYSTDLVAERTLDHLDTAIAAGEPFFVGVAPIGPHAEMRPSDSGVFFLPTPAERHADLFPGLRAPRETSFNKLRSNGVSYYRTLPELNTTELAYVDLFYRRRIQALQAIDELVKSVVTKLSEHPDVLNNTYIIYTSDNGFHLGQHRLPPGKTCNIEEDINVPFVVRGPGVSKGDVYDYPTTHTDIVPTLFQLAGIELHDDFDGEPIPVTTELQESLARKTEHVNVEYWGDGITEGTLWAGGSFSNNTYKTVRVVADDYDLAYAVWCTNEHELYNLKTDPYQTTNLYARDNITISGYNIVRLTARLDALLLTLKSCKGKVCRRPWETLHPQGNVHSLADAMSSKYDTFYEEQQRKVTFSECAAGYLTQYEGALEPLLYGEAAKRRVVKHWEWWT